MSQTHLGMKILKTLIPDFFFSISILRYLCQKFNVAEHWYPQTDLKQQARIEEYLHWQHLNTRMKAAMVFQHKVRQWVQHRMVLVVNFLFFCFVVAIFDLVHDVEALHDLC